MKEKLLFVTKGGENSLAGFSYVVELARTLSAGIIIMLVYSNKALDTYENLMTAITFAEAGEHETAKVFMREHEKNIRKTASRDMKELEKKLNDISIDFTYQVVMGDAISGIKDFMRNRSNIDMVLLSPNLSGQKNILDVKKLLKSISRPIVTISKPIYGET